MVRALRPSAILALAIVLVIPTPVRADHTEAFDNVNQRWQILSGQPFAPRAIAGDNVAGVITLSVSNQLAYDTSYAAGAWHSLPAPPITVTSLEGNNSYGPVIASNGTTVCYLNSYQNPVWHTLPATTVTDHAILDVMLAAGWAVGCRNGRAARG